MTAAAERGTALGDLDRALGPVRRLIRYALTPGARPRFVEANARRLLEPAVGLPLPSALRERLDEVIAEFDNFDAMPLEVQRQRLSSVYAGLARIDAIVGLPLPRARFRAIRKPVQRDEPEVAPDPVAETAAPKSAPAVRRAPKRSVDLSTPLSSLVTASVASAMAEQGLVTLQDVVQLPPTDREVLSIDGAGRPLEGEGRVAVGGRIRGSWTVLRAGVAPQTWTRVEGAGSVSVAWRTPIGAPWLDLDRRVVVVGVHHGGELRDAEVVAASDASVSVPRYELDGVEDAVIRALIALWSAHGAPVRDPLAAHAKAYELVTRQEALVGIHHVEEAARRRMAFDEAFYAQLAGLLSRQGGARGLPQSVVHGFAGHVSQTLELVLDDPQQRCLEDIKRDLRSPAPMRRVLTGEVGLGRGLVGLMAAAQVAEGRNQVLILADDDVSAATRHLFSEPVLHQGDISSRLVGSSLTGSQREAIRRGDIQVLFGPIDLLEQELEFRRLGLVVAVEREQWGRASRLHQRLSSPRPDLLVIPSVPVGPRLLLTAYADHDVSHLVNPERRAARILVHPAQQRERAYVHLREVVAAGRQAVVVFPMVRGRDALDVRGALRLVRALEDELLQGLRVGVDHGDMPPDERRRVLNDFAHRRTQVLVSTTRIEEGPQLPGPSLVVVEQAESVEAWRLHRIIGFFSRSAHPADAILVGGDLATESAFNQLRRLQEAPSGMALTELRVEASGLRESVTDGAAPLPTFSWLELDRDIELVTDGREAAAQILAEDSGLRRGQNQEILRELVHRWTDLWPEAPPDEWAPPKLESMGDGPRRRRRRRRRRR